MKTKDRIKWDIANELSEMGTSDIDECIRKSRELVFMEATHDLMWFIDGMDIELKDKRKFAERVMKALSDIGAVEEAESMRNLFLE